ncbi:MAG: hypothetical protein V4539_25455 [Bacteroidota bacterium]
MKKLIWLLVFLLVLFCAGVYIFIPSKLTITASTLIAVTDNGADRFITNENNWAKWWGYDSLHAASPATGPYLVNGDEFKMEHALYKSASIRIHHKEMELESKLSVIPFHIDSTAIEWTSSMATSTNPFTRCMQYIEAKDIKKNMDQVLASLNRFLSNNENVYGTAIEKTSIRDTSFISSKKVFKIYPTTPQIYELIKTIQAFAAKNNVKQTGAPIYNVMEIENKQFQLMAAIPVDRTLPDNNSFSSKRMVRGSFMVTEVVGGEYTVEKASQSLKQFFNDYRKTSMAINFTMLITDRMLQPDTSKWITKLYQPVY